MWLRKTFSSVAHRSFLARASALLHKIISTIVPKKQITNNYPHLCWTYNESWTKAYTDKTRVHYYADKIKKTRFILTIKQN
jgi:hypothetical protein